MVKSEIIALHKQICQDYDIKASLEFTGINPVFAAKVQRRPNGWFNIILTECNPEHLIHEVAHILEWRAHGDSSAHGYRWMQYYEKLEDQYVSN
ncbi:hypothetical protein VPHD42_0139 [Vibrio phage D42]